MAPETDIAVDELIEDGKFPDFFGDTAEKLEWRRILGAQFMKFCQDRPDKLRQNDYATFAVLTKKDEPVAEDLSNVFVAHVHVLERGRLFADVVRLGRRVWASDPLPATVTLYLQTVPSVR